jgi:hypothetical protein
MKDEISKLGAEMRGENTKFGIETLKKVQFVKAKLIKQLHDTIQAAKDKNLSGAGVFAWIDDVVAFLDALGRYKKIALEFEDLEEDEKKELFDYFVKCLVEQGLEYEDGALFSLAAKINEHVTDTALLLKEIAEFVKK